VQIHGPSVINPDPAAISVDVNDHDPDRLFVKVEFPGGIRFYLDNGDADVLIKVFCQAKDMLHAHQHAAVMTDPLAPLRDAPHFGDGLPVLDDDGGDGDDEPEPERTATPAEHADTAERIERAAEAREIIAAAGWDAAACAECGSREGTVVDGWHDECRAYRDGVGRREATTVGTVTGVLAAAETAGRQLAGEVDHVEFITDSRAPRIAQCHVPRAHGYEPTGTPVDCDVQGHHDDPDGTYVENITEVMAQAYVNTGLPKPAAALQAEVDATADAARKDGRG
jgi:hypothetical protein